MERSAIIVVNNDLVEQIRGVISRQLYIDETLTGEEFDARVAYDPTYPGIVHLTNQRILVIRSHAETFDRGIVDFVLFIKNGLAAVETSKYGPPGLTLSLDKLYLSRLFLNV